MPMWGNTAKYSTPQNSSTWHLRKLTLEFSLLSQSFSWNLLKVVFTTPTKGVINNVVKINNSPYNQLPNYCVNSQFLLIQEDIQDLVLGRQRNTNTVQYLLYMESGKVKLGEKEWHRVVVTRGWVGLGGDGEMLVKEHKFPVVKFSSSEDLMYSIVIIANNTVLYTWIDVFYLWCWRRLFESPVDARRLNQSILK